MSDPIKFSVKDIQLGGINIKNAAIDNQTELSELNSATDSYDMSLAFVPGFNIEEEKMRMIFDCTINVVRNHVKLDIQGRFELHFFYVVKNFSAFVKDVSEDSANVDQLLQLTAANVAYSTSRGIIYAKCQGTILKDAILPILTNDSLSDILSTGTIVFDKDSKY